MLWTIATMMVILWLLGLITGYTIGLFIHVLIAAAIVLLVIGINQEVGIYQELKKTLRALRYKKVNEDVLRVPKVD